VGFELALSCSVSSKEQIPLVQLQQSTFSQSFLLRKREQIDVGLELGSDDGMRLGFTTSMELGSDEGKELGIIDGTSAFVGVVVDAEGPAGYE